MADQSKTVTDNKARNEMREREREREREGNKPCSEMGRNGVVPLASIREGVSGVLTNGGVHLYVIPCQIISENPTTKIIDI
jgi:hypothetical protein